MNFRELRSQRNLSPREMATHLGLSLRTYERWETGETTPLPTALEGCARRLQTLDFKNARLTRGMTVKQMAAFLDVPLGTYTDWETKRTSPHQVTLEGCAARLKKV